MKRTSRKLVRDYVITIIAAITIAFLIRTFVIEAYRIPNSAMSPTLEAGDTLFALKWPFQWNSPETFIQKDLKRGDVVVYTAPGQQDGATLDYIRRIVGFPGDEVEIKNGLLILNGKQVTENPSPTNPCSQETLPEGRTYRVCFGKSELAQHPKTQIASQFVFVIGDFRETQNKKNKKNWGLIPVDTLKGKALWIWLSVEHSDSNNNSIYIPNIRWDRMFRRIE